MRFREMLITKLFRDELDITCGAKRDGQKLRKVLVRRRLWIFTLHRNKKSISEYSSMHVHNSMRIRTLLLSRVAGGNVSGISLWTSSITASNVNLCAESASITTSWSSLAFVPTSSSRKVANSNIFRLQVRQIIFEYEFVASSWNKIQKGFVIIVKT